MKFRQAAEQSIRRFYSGKLPEEAIAASDQEYIYDLEYFENIEPEIEAEDDDDGNA